MKNQSNFHYNLTQKTKSWLYSKVTQKGLRWKQEFTLINGARPDAVAFCNLQGRFFKKFTDMVVDWDSYDRKVDAISKRYLFLINETVDKKKRTELISEKWNKIEDIRKEFNVPENRFMFIFETKITVSDYNNTFMYDNHTISKLSPFANFHFLVIPKKLLRENNIVVPEIYGILEDSGRGLRMIRKPPFFKINELDFYKNAYNMLFRLNNI